MDASFQPGQAPNRKDTGELEPLLPQWLREAREIARESETNKPPEPHTPLSPSASNMDLLAGLQSQSGDEAEEEIPDWLASITGTAAPKPKPEETETGEVRWVEAGKRADFQQTETGNDEMPPWLAGIQPASAGAEDKDELSDWFRKSGEEAVTFETPSSQPSADGSPFSPLASSPDDTPDWLKQMSADAGEKQPEQPVAAPFESSDWFSQPSEPRSSQSLDFSSETPDWLKQIQTDANAAPSSQAIGSEREIPGWLGQEVPADSNIPAQPPASEPLSETPDWLAGLVAESASVAEAAPAESEALVSEDEVPSWLKPESDKSSNNVTPSWLQSESNTAEQPQASGELFNDLPDWLKSAAPPPSPLDKPEKAAEMPPAEPAKAMPFETVPAFAEGDLPAGGNAFLTEMPDWLSNAIETPLSAGIVPEPITSSDALAPNVLPSWVEAMRPSDQGMANILATANDQPLESQGALAGLQGVLPAGVGFTPTSKPKAYSIKINTSEEQLKHAAILEQILAAETAPVTISSEKSLGASRILRWALAFILLAVAFGTAFIRSPFFSTPVAIPNELNYAVAVAQAIPADAPVLVAVDYEPSRAGEMEAAAAPLLDNLLLIKHPRLTFVASNEAGSILAERLIAGPLAVHNYQSGVTYLNLGYLPGGQLGIRAFAQNPSATAPLDINGQTGWASAPLQGVTSLSEFAAILLITDTANAARAWIEQTQSVRGGIPILVVSSAQSTPMIQPYYESGQVNGIVSGLYGGALYEQRFNNGRPGTARAYWDAYSVGMLAAAVFLLGGGLINLGLGLRDRSAGKAGK
ncbi:MAG: hypothetical protein HXY38_06300 [Chloroflexi bacterium]|nr:hypothetical protein [Chloroflexota bacterium]